MEYEEFYVIASRDRDGGWSKFAKTYDLPGLNAVPFFWDLEKAKYFLENNVETGCREFFSIFRVIIGLEKVEKVK